MDGSEFCYGVKTRMLKGGGIHFLQEVFIDDNGTNFFRLENILNTNIEVGMLLYNHRTNRTFKVEDVKLVTIRSFWKGERTISKVVLSDKIRMYSIEISGTPTIAVNIGKIKK